MICGLPTSFMWITSMPIEVIRNRSMISYRYFYLFDTNISLFAIVSFLFRVKALTTWANVKIEGTFPNGEAWSAQNLAELCTDEMHLSKFTSWIHSVYYVSLHIYYLDFTVYYYMQPVSWTHCWKRIIFIFEVHNIAGIEPTNPPVTIRLRIT